MAWWDNDTNPVQAAQREYDLTMRGHWQRVIAGEITEADYWRISDGGRRAAANHRPLCAATMRNQGTQTTPSTRSTP